MKLIAGHRYLKDAAGVEIVPYTEQMAKTLGVGTNPLCKWVDFIAAETISNDMQLAENEKVVARKAIPVSSVKPEPVVAESEVAPEVKKPVPVMKVSLAKPVRPVEQEAQPVAKPVTKPVLKPVAKPKMQHMDIRSEMAADLAADLAASD